MKNLTNLYNYLPKFNKIILIIITSLILSNCGIYKKVDTRQTPINAQERARQAVTEGKGLGIGNILKREAQIMSLAHLTLCGEPLSKH